MPGKGEEAPGAPGESNWGAANLVGGALPGIVMVERWYSVPRPQTRMCVFPGSCVSYLHVPPPPPSVSGPLLLCAIYIYIFRLMEFLWRHCMTSPLPHYLFFRPPGR